MITFKSAEIEARFDVLHPELQLILEEFGHWAMTERLPLTCVTSLHRTPEENAQIYSGKERFSWHLLDKDGHGRAFDIRTREYSVNQRAKVIAWFMARCPQERFELIYKPHGTGAHLHLGLRKPAL